MANSTGLCGLIVITFVLVINVTVLVEAQKTVPVSQVYRLGKHDVFKDWITLSGFSSGGTFAQQLQISHSSLISGIAVFSHAYYRCGPGDGIQDSYDSACTQVGTMNNTYNPDNAIDDIETYRQQRLIDNPNNLRNKRLYVYAGTRNSFFSIGTSLGILRVYEPYIQNPCSIKTRIQEAEVVLPSSNFGNACTESAQDNFFIANCGFSGAHDALDFLLGGDHLQKTENEYRADPSQLLTFDQTEFFYGLSGDGRHDMDTIGYVFVPKRCRFKKCFLHFYFHGCLTGREFNGTSHIVNSGYLEVAELNDIIMIFPQAVSSEPENAIGCWDTYGLTGRLYATKRGAQVTVVRNMLSRVLGEDNQNGVATELRSNAVSLPLVPVEISEFLGYRSFSPQNYF